MRTTTGFTLIEVLVTIMVLCVLIAASVALLPRADRAPDTDTLPARVSSTLEAAHSQALEEGAPVTLLGQGDTLQISSAGETTADRFAQAALAGTLAIGTDGTASGAILLTPPGQPCTRLTLSEGGTTQQGGC